MAYCRYPSRGSQIVINKKNTCETNRAINFGRNNSTLIAGVIYELCQPDVIFGMEIF